MLQLFARVSKKKKAAEKNAPGRMMLSEIFSGQRRNEVSAIVWWATSLLVAAALWPHGAGQNALGPVGEIIFRLGFGGVGVLAYTLPFLAIWMGWKTFRDQPSDSAGIRILGVVTGALALGVLVELIHPEAIAFARVRSFYAWEGAARFWQGLPAGVRLWDAGVIPAGGLVADAAERILVSIFSSLGAYIISITALIVAIYLLEAEPVLHGLVRTVRDRAVAMINRLLQPRAPRPAVAGLAKPRSVKPADRSGTVAPLLAEQERAKIKITTPQPMVQSPSTRAKEIVKKSMATSETDMAPAPPESHEEKKYRLPGLELLADPQPHPELSVTYFEGMSQTLENALAQFGVAAKVVEVCPGPVVTRYELQPSPGVKVNRILSLADDIALAMKAEHVRIEAPIPGKGAVGIEIPNREKQVVVLKELLATEEFNAAESVLSFAVGKDIGGKHVLARLETMPHLLIAGSTGSGKSACINAIICSLLYRATPNQVRFLMIDPKRVELTMYQGIPHLKSPVITDSREAAVALRLMVREMEERYKLFAEHGVRDIAAFNERVDLLRREALESVQEEPASSRVPSRMTYIVVFIDELADLMLVAANEVENTITRLAQMARGVGIHMVLATQRPSVDVITGVIKANFPSRIAFQVSSKVDSRTILDANGADALLGRGDMLYAPASASKPLRVQGVFVTTAEVERIARAWQAQGEPVYDSAFAPGRLKSEGSADEGGEGEDELFHEAVGWVVRAKQASTSMLQRRLKVGYSRAARLLDLMEEKGIVGPPEGSKPRKVLVDPETVGVMAGGVGDE